MKISIVLNNQIIEKDIPISWEEVDFGTFLQLDSCGDDKIKAIALFTGIDYEDLKKAKIYNFDSILAILGFLNVALVPSVPEKILGYPVPKKLEFEQVQQYIDLKNYLKESEHKTDLEKLKAYTTYCAVYACVSKHVKYDWQLSEAMADEFLKAPCTEVVGIGNFTLAKLIVLKADIDPNSRLALSPWKKLKLAIRLYLLRMVSRLHWTIWSKKLGVKKMNY